MTTYQVHLKKMTAGIVVDDGAIIETAPTLKRFRGARLDTLVTWVGKRGCVVGDVRDESLSYLYCRTHSCGALDHCGHQTCRHCAGRSTGRGWSVP